MTRIHGLDQLRGLAALGIMIYHYSTWAHGPFDAGSVLGRIGIYGVSVFYVLSGITLYTVYHDRLTPSTEALVQYFKRRFLRIFPLLWLVTGVAILLSGKSPDLMDLALNLTGLFGLVSWDRTFSAGIWSIGNELVFYLLFPVMVLLMKRKGIGIVAFTALWGALYLHFAYQVLDDQRPLLDQWRNYTNPLDQAFLFIGGVWIGSVLRERSVNKYLLMALLALSGVFFLLHPAQGDPIVLVTGENRVLFTAWCFVVCACAYRSSFPLPSALSRPLSWLGSSSYSIYLLHPLVWNVMLIMAGILGRTGLHLTTGPIMALSILSTLVISHFVHEHFEKYFMNLGRRPTGTKA